MKVSEKQEGHGYILEFENGHRYNVVNLGKILQATMIDNPVEDEGLKKKYIKSDEMAGRKYDAEGGRYEAMLLTHRDEVFTDRDPVVFRGHSFNEVITKVKSFEEVEGRDCCT